MATAAPSPIDSQEITGLGDRAPLSEADLASERGGEGVDLLVLNNSDVKADLTNNTVTSSTTGGNFISDNAFNNVTGFPTVIQNTGNNVIIQSSTIVNLSIAP